MLTKLTIRNFKLFDEVEIELGDRVVLVGPNNSGKTSALQALALWDIGAKRWLEKRGSGQTSLKRSGVTINRRDLVSVPTPTSNLLWRDLHVRASKRANGKNVTENVLVGISVEGIRAGELWTAGFEFDYANEESFYCRPLRLSEEDRMPVPEAAGNVRIAFLPPMSGMTSAETKLDPGAINVRMGEGRTAEVLRNLCYLVLQTPEKWRKLEGAMQELFGIQLLKPEYIPERGEITMRYKDRRGIGLDLSSSGRGQQQTLLLLAHMYANPGAVLLLDEPDAHLEILRQRQIYQILTDTAAQTGSQIIAASHSEVILNEAADRDIVIAFVGKPHRIDNRGSQVMKSLKEIGFDHYYQAEETGWVLYLEGSTDLAILRAFADKLNHTTALEALQRPFVHYVFNQAGRARDHFYGLSEAKTDLAGMAIYDHLDRGLPNDPNLEQTMWSRREIENYLAQKETLLAYAEALGRQEQGELFAAAWKNHMEQSISEIETALTALGKPSPWSADIKASDDFLDPLFKNFFQKLGLPNLMRKTDYHQLAPYVPVSLLDAEIREKLDAIAKVAAKARPRTQ